MLILNRYQPLLSILATLSAPLLYLVARFRAQLGGAKKLSASLKLTPPAFAAQLATAAKISAKFLAALNAGITPPKVSVGLALVARLQALLTKYQALVSIAGSAQAMIYEGPLAGLGAAVQSAAGSTFSTPLTGASAALAVTLLVSEGDSVATGALKALFGAVGPTLPASAQVSIGAAFAVFLGPLGLLLALLSAQIGFSLTGLAVISVQLPWITLAPQIIASINATLAAALQLGLALPTLTLTLDANLGLILAIEATLNVAIALLASLNAGAQVMAYSGALSGLGGALQNGAGHTPGSPVLGPANVYAVTLLVDAGDAVSLAAIKQVFSLA